MNDDRATAAKKITTRIKDLGDWRGETLARVRKLIHDADPKIQEEWKWEKPSSPGIPVWSHDGGVCTGETYKDAVKLTFFRGASLKDPKKLFTSSLEGKVRRAVSVIKKRTGFHENTIREYRIDSNGLSLGEPLVQFQGVLRGVPTFVGGDNPLMAKGAEGDGQS